MKKLDEIKIIDFHVHIGLKEHWYEWIHAYQKKAHSEYYERYEEMIDPKRFAAYLKSHQIEKAVILPEISPITTGVVSNEYVIDFCLGNDTFLPFCTVNPLLVSQPTQELRKYIKMGVKGIKLYPSYNHFYPNDSSLYPLYEIAQEHRLPVLIHTGSSVFKGSKVKYADPIYLDDVASDFPDLLLLMAHSGRGLWYEKAFFLSRLHPNIYLEISGLPPKNLLNYFPEMEKDIEKFVYGSDWPGIKTINSNIEAIKELPLAEESIRKILYENAAAILGLK
ncbi:MAG: amidohydrolase family protein [Candidatus Aminicenantes bacterium]|nr:amidohydrolase family protein [Candidatus Aminicenantes bacterium]